ncbi:hypothetical protein [Nocardia grenadensis]|uniref:hypothetical protein n=1 Tax=Nocardia grenadensis TaxID=931537 RepID=UPI003D72CFA1
MAVVVRQLVFAEAAGPAAIDSGTGFEPPIRVYDREAMATLRFGALYPTANADVEDFQRLLGRVSPPAGPEVVESRWPPGVDVGLTNMSDDRLTDAAAGLGDPTLLATALDGSVGRFEAVALAVTSESFLRSAHDHRRQLATPRPGCSMPRHNHTARLPRRGPPSRSRPGRCGVGLFLAFHR